MTSKGQVTVPSAVREFFGLKPGDIVDFYIGDHGRVEIIARNKAVSELFGMLNKHVDLTQGPLTQASIDEAIGNHLAEEDVRITQQRMDGRESDAPRARKMAVK